MITFEVNGQRIEAETEKEARKLLAKAVKQEKKEAAERNAKWLKARAKAEAAGYKVLARKASGEQFPRGWRYYPDGHQWASHLFVLDLDEPCNIGTTHKLNTEDGDKAISWHHYGYRLLGAVCNGSGYCWVVAMQDADRPEEIELWALGVEQDQIALVDLPGIKIEDFDQSPD